MKLKNLIYICSILLIFFNINFLKAENIAFIDLNRIFDNSEAGKKIIKQVKEKQKKNLKFSLKSCANIKSKSLLNISVSFSYWLSKNEI